MSVQIFHPVRFVLYALLSLADLYLTHELIRQGDGEVYESNPIAEAWLSSYGWAGLGLFKLLIVLVVAAVAAFISLSRPRTGGHILTFACLAVAGVVSYSIYLSLSEEVQPKFAGSPLASAPPSVAGRVHRLAWGDDQHLNLFRQIRQDLILQKCTLTEAVDTLAATERAKDPEWLQNLREDYSGRTDRERLAAYLVDRTVNFSLRYHPSQAERIAAGLNADFLASYGTRVPGLAVGMWTRRSAE